MRIAIFTLRSFYGSLESEKFIIAAHELGIDVSFFCPSDVYIAIQDGEIQIFDRENKVLNVDGAINWIDHSNFDEISYALKSMGIPYMNSSEAVRLCKNKALTSILLSDEKIKQPHTVFYPRIGKSKIINPDISMPVVYKSKTGAKGIDLARLVNHLHLKLFVNDKDSNSNVYLQEYLNNCGYIIRVVVVGNEVVGSLKVHYPIGEWRTHGANGGRIEECKAKKELKQQCLDVSKKLGMDFCEIDILPCVDGKDYVLEVNALPEINTFCKVTSINLAQEILQHIICLINAKMSQDSKKKKILNLF